MLIASLFSFFRTKRGLYGPDSVVRTTPQGGRVTPCHPAIMTRKTDGKIFLQELLDIIMNS